MTLSCRVIATSSTLEAVRSGRSSLRKGCDLVEIRLDHLRDLSPGRIERLAGTFGRKAIATLRSQGQGGRWRGRRVDVLLQAAVAGFGYIDVEVITDRRDLETIGSAARRSRTKVIASHHDLGDRSRGRVSAMLERCCQAGDIGKVVVTPRSIASAMGLVEIARAFRRRGERFTLIGMGSAGAITRALAREMGCQLQYLRADDSEGAAPGQLSLAEWKGITRGRRSLVTGLVGRPIRHSVSFPMQEAAFRATGLAGAYVRLESGSRRDLASLIREPGIRGVNVTMPLKEAALDLVDRCDPVAREVGAINTILLDGGEAVGFNTDVHGFRRLLGRIRLRRAERVLVVGAGGAARAVIHVLSRGMADEILVSNRTGVRARRIVTWAGEGVRAVSLGDVADAGPFDLVVNCTPVGMAGVKGGGLVPSTVFRKGAKLIDLVYNPPKTRLMMKAEKRGARAVGGLEMLVHQGARSFEIWTRRKAPIRAMRRAALAFLEGFE